MFVRGYGDCAPRVVALTAVDVVRSRAGVPILWLGEGRSVRRVLKNRGTSPADGRLVLRQLDVLASAGAATIAQRGQNRHRRLQRIAADVRVRIRRRAHWRPVGEAGDHVHAGKGLDPPADATIKSARPALPHGRHRQVDQIRTGFSEGLVGQAKVL